ncbi:MAG: PfkB family carbohydrate kinase, partial [Amphiplicatus sp.]
GRAAAALARLSQNVQLHAYASKDWVEDARHSMAVFGVKAHLIEIDENIGFHYFHPLSNADLEPATINRSKPLRAEGDAALRFGFVEGDAILKARRVVYDPQNAADVLSFRDNGSEADELAICLNELELRLGVGQSESIGARRLMQQTGAKIVVVKRGVRGAVVYEGKNETVIPAYKADPIFKIGSGDIFTAVFAHAWAEEKISSVDAARRASRAVSRYVQSRNIDAVADENEDYEEAPTGSPGQVYLAAPFFNLGQRWAVEEARAALLRVGATVFSPFHEVGVLGGSRHIAEADLAGLREAKSVLAIIDGEDTGTLFEVGYARDRGLPVVALAESVRGESLTMLEGSGCRIVNDFTTAVYHAAWEASS